MKLFQPGNIGKLTLKNRIAMAAINNMLIEFDGRLSERGIDYYVARARGGTGLIITGTFISRLIETLPSTPLSDTAIIDGRIYAGPLSELAEGVHDYGAKVAVQVNTGQGRNLRGEVLKSSTAVAPSVLPTFERPDVMTRELTTEEVERLTKSFEFMAEVIRTAGIDAIEINAHGGYLCDQFMTALWNKRTDKYGGDLDGRLTFLLEIIESVRRGAGADFPIIVKYGLTHYLEGGREIEEGLQIARRLEAAGVDALDIDAGCYETIYWIFPTTTQPPGCMVDLAAKVKQVVNIPVIAVGKLHYPDLAERVLQEGKADFVALGRGLLADPEWPNKVKEGRLEDICPCLGDHDGCRRRTYEGKSISCTVNPSTGMERNFTLSPADRKKSVLVIGGGPGGMEAAMIAALRGHKVTLCEKRNALGGNLIPASVPDFKQDYRTLINYLSTQIRKQGVEIRLDTEVSLQLIQEMKPDVVFVATGAMEIVPAIPGVDKKKVATAVDVLLGRKEVSESVVLIGGGTAGCETALHLANKGKKVTVVEMLDSIVPDMYLINREHLLKLLADANVQIRTGATVLRITEDGVVTADIDARESMLAAESVVLAVGLKSDSRLFEALQDKVPELHAIGDCVQPRNVMHAIREAFRGARLI
ncbi:FAD-dependent oxidoreductase [Chloroflexota bacterium]